MTALTPILYKDWLNLKINLLWCYDRQVTDSSDLGRAHLITGYRNNAAWLVREGWAEVIHGKQTYRAGPGQWLIVKPIDRVQRLAPETHLLSLSFEACWPDGSNWLDEGLSVVLNAADYPELEARALPIVDMMSSVPKDSWDIRDAPISPVDYLNFQSLIITWLAQLEPILRQHGVKPTTHAGLDDRVTSAIRLLDSQPPGEPFDPALLASKVGISPVHLNRLFRQHLNLTPKAYLEKRRLTFACQRLRLPDARVKDIAIDLGFAHLSHFSKWFRQKTGTPPTQYQRKTVK